VTKPDGTPYKVFTPFRRAWQQHGWRRPADTDARTVAWLDPDEKHGGPRSTRIPDDDRVEAELPPAGEEVALARWQEFLDDGATAYKRTRDRPDRPGTSRMSVHLKYGTVHPRTLLADLAGRSGDGVETLRSELAWREFYADVLWHRPDSARENFDRKFDALPWDSGPAADEHFAAWAEGRTGFPIVDAGMRQLREMAWVHNRVRMIVASFLVKDLHLHWTRGARHFMRYLADGDLASNNHGWQWVAGTGTDAAPFFRVFNPVVQGEKFDPEGDYVRRFVPELRNVPGKAVHRPWELPGGPPNGYPRPVVDHAEERRAALDRYEQVRAGSA
jgi:deoxyribodipyrimidine photo-lyase